MFCAQGRKFKWSYVQLAHQHRCVNRKCRRSMAFTSTACAKRTFKSIIAPALLWWRLLSTAKIQRTWSVLSLFWTVVTSTSVKMKFCSIQFLIVVHVFVKRVVFKMFLSRSKPVVFPHPSLPTLSWLKLTVSSSVLKSAGSSGVIWPKRVITKPSEITLGCMIDAPGLKR